MRSDELEGLAETEARDLTGIADRLAAKRRFDAAAKEYTKALERAGGPNPRISARLASVLLELGSQTKVEAVISPTLELDPDHVLLYLYRGKARLASGDAEGAKRDLSLAMRLNPFDPEVHALLADALTALGDERGADAERRRHRLVSQDGR